MMGALSFVNACPYLLLILLVLLQVMAAQSSNPPCISSSCGNIHNISQPFRLKNDPKGCGESQLELACEDNHTVVYLYGARLYVQSIDYSSYAIRLVDDGLQKNNCSSLPHYSFTPGKLYNTSFDLDDALVGVVVIVNCSKPVSSPLYISAGPCIKGLYASNISSIWNLYALINPTASAVRDFCTIHSWTWQSKFPLHKLINSSYYMPSSYEWINSSSYNYEMIHHIMAEGFDAQFFTSQSQSQPQPQPQPQSLRQWVKTFFCSFDFYDHFHLYEYFYSAPLNRLPSRVEVCGSRYYDEGSVLDVIVYWTTWNIPILLVLLFVVKFVIGAPFVATFLIYKYSRRHLAMDKNIEEFLQAHNNFLPIRYSYSNIKKITGNFKHKLGEGGYGAVYKGTLRSGNEVAIKILKEAKANGQDFISEVGTIGRVHHVNIVQLQGFCFEGSKQALVYDLMSNGSLDKHIFSKEGDKSLDYERIYEIALGIARGIEYLHRGCDMQILHFDIKPHNILLDGKFTPKLSDFGLAKLYPTNRSIVSLTAARGTLGYMAPELFYKDIGGVSYKADVYSFGMLLMEMAGRRKNVNANAEHSSQIYFPLWVYDHVGEGESVAMEEVVEEERNMIKKMIIVALWCIQLNLDHRPPMNKVLEMLEGDIGNIQMPPKPLIYPPNEPVDDEKVEIELETFSSSSSAPIISTSFPFEDCSDV